MWKKVEPSGNIEDILANGSTILTQDSRFSVEINRYSNSELYIFGSTLAIALAEDSDAGHYICQLGSNEEKELKHKITVRGKICCYLFWKNRVKEKPRYRIFSTKTPKW